MTTAYAQSQRARYMRHEITHHEYYGLLVDLLGEESLRATLPLQTTPEKWRALIAEDEHLNNVSLRKWDQLDPYVRGLVRQTDAAERVAITGSNGWSLSDSVCVLKTAARRYAGV
jgi:hypothetical protein